MEEAIPKRSLDPEAREKQLVNLAYNEAERLMQEGKAPPSVINHFLKIGSTREQKELKKLEAEVVLTETKVNQIDKSSTSEETARKAIEAMRSYRSSED